MAGNTPDRNELLPENDNVLKDLAASTRRALSWVALSVLAATTAVAEDVVTPAEYQVSDEGATITLYEDWEVPTELPSVDLLTSFHPEIAYEAIVAFHENFNSLWDGERSHYLTDFMELSHYERSVMFRIYASAYEWVSHPIKKKILVKLSIDIPDILENLRYVVENDGDIRNGDAVEILFHLENLFDKFPDTQHAMTPEFINEASSLYQNAYNLATLRLASAEAELWSVQNELQSTQEEIDSLKSTVESMQEELRKLQDLRIRMETLQTASLSTD